MAELTARVGRWLVDRKLVEALSNFIAGRPLSFQKDTCSMWEDWLWRGCFAADGVLGCWSSRGLTALLASLVARR